MFVAGTVSLAPGLTDCQLCLPCHSAGHRGAGQAHSLGQAIQLAFFVLAMFCSLFPHSYLSSLGTPRSFMVDGH